MDPTTKERGLVNYDMHQGPQDPALFDFYENWESEDSLDAHSTHPTWSSSPPGCTTCSRAGRAA